jgi:hypothetical protein
VRLIMEVTQGHELLLSIRAWSSVAGMREKKMQFLLLIYDDEKRWNKLGKPDYGSELDEYRAFSKEFAKAIQGGNALQATNTSQTVRVRDGKSLVTDGPFAETKEQLAGFYLVEASNRDEAIGIAAKIPGARHGSIEVRPILKFS